MFIIRTVLFQLEGNIHFFLPRQFKSMLDSGIIRSKSQQSAQDGLIRSMALICFCKGIEKSNLYRVRDPAKEIVPKLSDRYNPAVWELDGPTIMGPIISKQLLKTI